MNTYIEMLTEAELKDHIAYAEIRIERLKQQVILCETALNKKQTVNETELEEEITA